MNITTSEEAVLTACIACMYGELKDVQIEDGPTSVSKELKPEQSKFITLLRDNAIMFASKILVHNAMPMQVETDGVSGTIKYRRKLRI